MSVLFGIETDIVSRLQTVSYLADSAGGTVRGISDGETVQQLSHVTPPAVLVGYAGELPAPGRAGPLHMGEGSNKAQHYMRVFWDLLLFAQNFGGRYDDLQNGRGDDSGSGEKGVMTIVDDVFAKLAGYQLPSATGSKTFWMGVSPPQAVSDAVIVYMARIYADILRSN